MIQLTKTEMEHLTGGNDNIIGETGYAIVLGSLDHGGGFHDQPANPLDDTDTEFAGALGPMDHGGG